MQVDDQAIFKVRLFREDLNFSAGHISIYGDSIEGHHGHNYGISVEIEGPLNQDGLVIDFRSVKKVLKSIKAQMNHRTIVPKLHPSLEINSTGKSIRIRFRDEKLEFPARDVVLLDIANVTSELLAHYIYQILCDRLPTPDLRNLRSLTVEVVESPGQCASFSGPLIGVLAEG
jgi:6-pyruvoyl-tetrahydropterin synthase